MAWQGGLRATHFWDCNGAGCDAATLQPWEPRRYVYSPRYAPLDPSTLGGAQYGESLWLTAAASRGLAALLAADAPCCGADANDGSGGCGRCLLVRNPAATRANLTAVVMKKSFCPPANGACAAAKAHVDIAVPGFDYAPASDAQVCGSAERADTFLSRAEAEACGAWWQQGANAAAGCDCSRLRADTPERLMLRRGCELFAAWGVSALHSRLPSLSLSLSHLHSRLPSLSLSISHLHSRLPSLS